MTTANPLRQPRPEEDASLRYRGRRWRLVDEAGVPLPFAFAAPRLCETYLWLSEELAIPLTLIEDVRRRAIGLIIRRHVIEIDHANPLTGRIETARLAKLDPFGAGFYRRKPLEDLEDALREAIDACPEALLRAEPTSDGGATASPDELACERCGQAPACYVTFGFAVSILLYFDYRTMGSRRVACPRHILLPGLTCYLITALTGWLGLGLLRYPFDLYRSVATLRPAVGTLPAIVLYLGPLCGVGYAVYLLASLWTGR